MTPAPQLAKAQCDDYFMLQWELHVLKANDSPH